MFLFLYDYVDDSECFAKYVFYKIFLLLFMKIFGGYCMNKILKIFKYVLIFILVFLAVICLSVFIQTKTNKNKIPSIFGYKPFIVLSGSMESQLNKGDLAIVKEVDIKSLKENDIIAFRDTENHVVTHRIVNVIRDNGKVEFITKGDNNNLMMLEL